MSSNPGDKILILVESREQIFPSFWTLSPGLEENYTLKCWFRIFATSLIYVAMLENSWNIIWMYGCSPIQPWPHSGTYVSTFKGSRVPLAVLKVPKLEDYLAELNGDKNFLKAFLNLLPLYKSGNLIFFKNGSYQIRKNIWYWNGNFTSIVFCQTYIFFNRILHPIQNKFFFFKSSSGA